MDSYKRVRESAIVLQSRTLEQLREELQTVLSSISQRQPRDITLQAMDIPQSFGATIKAGEAAESLFAYPKGGILKDFFTHLDVSGKDLFISLTAYDSTSSVRQTIDLKDSFREYPTTFAVKEKSFLSCRIVNNSKVDANIKFGFSYTEGK